MATGNKTVIFYITENGRRLSEKIRGLYHDALTVEFNAREVGTYWKSGGCLIFIMASGIVVRAISSLIEDKRRDPAVIVLDEKGRHVISLLSGHLGGANDTARELAKFLDGDAVITTASDVQGLPALDLWAEENGLVIDGWDLMPKVSTRYVDNGIVRVYSETGIKMPPQFLEVSNAADADVLITSRTELSPGTEQVFLRPKTLVLGIGCNSGTTIEEIEDAVGSVLGENKLSFLSLHSIATIDKKGNEPGLVSFAEKHGLDIVTFTPEQLNGVAGVSKSEAVFKATGAFAVSEPAALLSSGSDGLLIRKQKVGNVTVAAAETKPGGGKIFIVGTGPGDRDHVTPAARDAIMQSDVIVGYGPYIELIEAFLGEKEIISTGMTREVDRCKRAIEKARNGKTVAVISGGDPGIYAMAGLVFELLRSEDRNGRMPVEVIPGISALNAAAAKLGAPLMHDFASISLSDRLTPWEVIEKRLEAAASADFVIVLYNPRSKGRQWQIGKALEITLKHRVKDTPVGIVKGAMRENERIIVTDLGSLRDEDVDMQTTVIIGNSKTFTWNNLLITPRGYEKKFEL